MTAGLIRHKKPVAKVASAEDKPKSWINPKKNKGKNKAL